METIVVDLKKRSGLKKLEVANSIVNTEGNLYLINLGKNWKSEPKLLKEFSGTNTLYLSHKLSTINNLIGFRNELEQVEELVLPEKIAFIKKKDPNGKIIEAMGYVMPYIKDNINLQLILKHKDIDIEDKIKYLKMIGNIIRKTLKLNVQHEGFYLGDIHEGNFIYDFEKDQLRVIDLDSSKIAGSYPFPSKYLEINKIIKSGNLSEKYPKNYKGIYIPNENTEWLCFITIILNSISCGKMTNLRLEEYYDYLIHLRDIGFPYELLDKFSNIYQENDNEDPTSYLDLIPKDVSGADLDEFIKSVRVRK